MKKIIALSLLVGLNGCAQIKMMLVKHDPALANLYVETVVRVEEAKCDTPASLLIAQDAANRMAKYAEFRDDPQKESARAVQVNLGKAIATKDEAACKRWLNLSSQRLGILNKAWSDR